MEVKFSPQFKRTLRYYYTAKDAVVSSGYAHEIYWQDIVSPEKIDVKSFFSEYAWVVLSSGMRETVIKNKFTELTGVFENWENPSVITMNRNKYFKKALKVFNHEKKIDALLWMADRLTKTQLEEEVSCIKERGVEYLYDYPFLGPATSLHFAKNIGFIVAKPDRHLLRISSFLGYSSPEVLCKKISDVIGEKESIIDLILWRYATLNKKYLT
jgi:hypothetical protein